MTRPDARPKAHARIATRDDKDQLFRLTRAFASSRGITIDDDSRDRALELVLSVPAVGIILVSEDRGGLSGYAMLSYGYDLKAGGRTAWLNELFVVPEWRGAGRGKAIVELAVATARDANARALQCLATDVDKDAIGLFKHLGCVADVRRIHTRML